MLGKIQQVRSLVPSASAASRAEMPTVAARTAAAARLDVVEGGRVGGEEGRAACVRRALAPRLILNLAELTDAVLCLLLSVILVLPTPHLHFPSSPFGLRLSLCVLLTSRRNAGRSFFCSSHMRRALV